MKRFFGLIIGLILFSSSAFAQTGSTAPVTVSFADNGKALLNPGMGWTFHFYSNDPINYGRKLEPSDALDWFEGCSVVYLRLPWAYIEPEEGVFNWAIVDTPAQRWIAAGKKVAFRFTTSENWMEYATPKWVFDAGAQGERYTWGKGVIPDGVCVDPVFDDPIYLEKLSNFLHAAGLRYDGNPDIAFIDVGTYGMWGEGHSNLGVWTTDVGTRMTPERTMQVVKAHIDLHKKHFPNVLLCISDDVAGPFKKEGPFPEMDLAFESGVSLRDDSILVSAGEKAWYHANMAQKFWPVMPVILEHNHLEDSMKRGAWDNDKLYESIEAYHASYMSIHCFPDIEWENCKDVIRKINRRIGYRLLPKNVSYPQEVAIDTFFDICWSIANVGVAPCYDGGFVAFTIKDEKGGIVSLLVDESFDVQQLEVTAPGEAAGAERKSRFRIGHVAPATAPGRYDLYISVGRRDGTPLYELPLDGSDGAKRYKVGQITIK